jgi:hypothetical protein
LHRNHSFKTGFTDQVVTYISFCVFEASKMARDLLTEFLIFGLSEPPVIFLCHTNGAAVFSSTPTRMGSQDAAISGILPDFSTFHDDK